MDERDPVDDSEFVFRRIPTIYYDSGLPIPVQREAFRPNPNDTSGLSVFRERFAQPLDALANVAQAKLNDYYVARVAVRALKGLGLTVCPDPLSAGPLGHAILPELTWTAYQTRKEYWKPLLVQLAVLASGDIVHRPS